MEDQAAKPVHYFNIFTIFYDYSNIFIIFLQDCRVHLFIKFYSFLASSWYLNRIDSGFGYSLSESFSENLLEYPQYTKPEEFRFKVSGSRFQVYRLSFICPLVSPSPSLLL